MPKMLELPDFFAFFEPCWPWVLPSLQPSHAGTCFLCCSGCMVPSHNDALPSTGYRASYSGDLGSPGLHSCSVEIKVFLFMSEQPFPSLFCYADPLTDPCPCCPQLSWVTLALNAHHAEHSSGNVPFLGIQLFATRSFLLTLLQLPEE